MATTTSGSARGPSPLLFFDTVWAYQRTEAIKTAIELDLFSAIGEGATTAAAIAARSGSAERGIRILCDFLVIGGLITKSGDGYALTEDSAAFLDRRSPYYLGGTIEFLLSPGLVEGFRGLTGAVRKGGTAMAQETVSPENPIWVQFARAMAPMMSLPAEGIAGIVGADSPCRVLDIAAGHGLFGIAIARRNPNAEIVALDWAPVLEVAHENAAKAAVGDRHKLLAGSAFDVDFGGPYDVVLLTNFLHHFDVATCETLLRKVHAALAPGGRAITLEFVPNPDRVTPPASAAFSLTMLASTASGDAYTFAELESMFAKAGFVSSALRELYGTVEQAVVSSK